MASRPGQADPMADYTSAVQVLARNPQDRQAQHKAVLSLARLGATDLAMQEYARFGLDGEQDDEDVLALRGRLFKDVFRHGPDRSKDEAARLSADAYLAAFERTGGTYSGINAATMMRLASVDPAPVEDLAREVLRKLEAQTPGNRSERYFSPATRAEAHLLLGDEDRARMWLSRAMDSDPLHYTAHAATLGQFRLIGRAMDRDLDWLEDHAPPRPVAYSGHIWNDGSDDDADRMQTEMSDLIQAHDLGFAYGALAAGADIVFAEACLAEGVALHVRLPQPVEAFIETSVRPSGSDWQARFEACLSEAASLFVLTQHCAAASEEELNEARRLCAEVAMGQAILRGRQLERDARYLAIQRDDRPRSLTHYLERRWTESGLVSLTLVPGGDEIDPSTDVVTGPHPHRDVRVVAIMPDTRQPLDAHDFLSKAQSTTAAFRDRGCFVDFEAASTRLRATQLPHSVTISESVAAWMTLHDPRRRDLVYAGLFETETGPKHGYTLLAI